MDDIITIDRPADFAEEPVNNFPGILMSIGWIILFFVLQVVASICMVIAVVARKTAAGEDMTHLAPDKMMEAVGGLPIIWSLIASSLLTLLLLWLYLRKKERAVAIHLERWSQLDLKQTIILAVVCVGGGLLFNFLYEAYVIPGVKIKDQFHKLFE